MIVPKLRVFVKELSKMFLPEDIVYIDYSEKTVTVRGCQHSDCDTCHDEYSWEQCEIMQSTGLFDSSLEPVEIYKDDIVTKSLPKLLCLVGVVTFTKGMFLVDGVEVIDQSWVVIGNIHEHPHLLEGLNGG